MLDVKELKELSVEELKAKCESLSRDLYQMRCEQRVARKLEKPHLLREKKRDRARILTILSQKSA